MQAPKYWMITDRDEFAGMLGILRANQTYWVSQGGPLDDLANWKKVPQEEFRKLLLEAVSTFPFFGRKEERSRNEEQKHLTLFLHGYNVNWAESAQGYESLCKKLYSGDTGMGICILYSWPSDGLVTNYYPDRIDAELCAPDLAKLLTELYDWLIQKQKEGAIDPAQACRAKTSVIAHSMGNYLLQKAMKLAWTRQGQPLLTSLVNQLVMVAADVDNDLFKSGETVDKSDGDAVANLTYRVTSLYSRKDPVLGLSAGLKHFGKRRLGRSGLDQNPKYRVPDNVWEYECSALFDPGQFDIHHDAYFHSPKVIELVRQILKGTDRELIRQMSF